MSSAANALAGVDENDPDGMRRFMKKMGEATGEDPGEDFEAAMQEEAHAERQGSDTGGGADES